MVTLPPWPVSTDIIIIIIIIIIIKNKKEATCIQMNVSIPADRNVPQKTAETKTHGF
jgi:hypothetical protein